MINATLKQKVVVPIAIKEVLESGNNDMQHISAMLIHNVLGVGLSPFIILTSLKNLPDELRRLAESQQIWVTSSVNGYMTRDLFLIWIIHFINWMSHYRLTLPGHLREATALLIVDGHTSRECPIGLLLLRKAKIDVLVIRSHCTHVLQMFDVVLAGPLKQEFTAKFRKLLKKSDNLSGTTAAAKVREAAVLAFVHAWRHACTPVNCVTAARKTGYYPLNVQAAEHSPFVRNLTVEEQARFDAREKRNSNRILPNNRLITEATFIVELAKQVKSNPKFEYLTNLQPYLSMTYWQIASDMLGKMRNDARRLTPLPPFFRPNDSPIFL